MTTPSNPGDILSSHPDLPAFRIVPLLHHALVPAMPTGHYALVVNWDPLDETFVLNDDSVKFGERGKLCGSWTQAYDATIVAIAKIEKHRHREALLRGLTPIPLFVLKASVREWDAKAAIGIGVRYSWRFLSEKTNCFNVEVDEERGVFKGTHNTH